MTATTRVFVAAPDEALVRALVASLTPERFEALGARDVRNARVLARGGAVDAVLVSETFEAPDASTIAAALRQALGPACAMILVTRKLLRGAPPEGFDAALKFPVAAAVMGDKIEKTAHTRRAAHTMAPKTLEAEIEIRFARRDSQNHYELLGVAPDAPADELTRAYDALSLLLHPDRLRAFSGSELEEMGLQLYMSIGAAYKVLRTRNGREHYDAHLRGETATASGQRGDDGPRSLQDLSDTPSVRKALRVAQSALASGNVQMAVVQLRFAANLEPGNARIAQALADAEARG